ncbi:RDD family protein [Rapidithrix thailandica]|uniref:RDD family protein n=1 Tax=Rapidithrix thailandica TaxID=413964 RepID=A0AAW9S3K7_9BACT
MMLNKRISFRKPRHTKSLELQFGIRLFALIIDLMLIKIFILSLTGDSDSWQTESIIGFSEITFLTLPVYWLYFAVLEGTLGATLGKLFTRLRIYNSNGSKLGLAKAIIRFPLKVISMISLLGVLMIDINKEKQGLHDLICGTIVRRV